MCQWFNGLNHFTQTLNKETETSVAILIRYQSLTSCVCFIYDFLPNGLCYVILNVVLSRAVSSHLETLTPPRLILKYIIYLSNN